jgi:hypothetical protein
MKSPMRAWPRSSVCDGLPEEPTASRQFAQQCWTAGSRQQPISRRRPNRPEIFHSPLALQRRIEDDAVATSTAARRKAAKRPRVMKELNTVASLTGIDTSKQYPGADDLEFWE